MEAGERWIYVREKIRSLQDRESDDDEDVESATETRHAIRMSGGTASRSHHPRLPLLWYVSLSCLPYRWPHFATAWYLIGKEDADVPDYEDHDDDDFDDHVDDEEAEDHIAPDYRNQDYDGHDYMSHFHGERESGPAFDDGNAYDF